MLTRSDVGPGTLQYQRLQPLLWKVNPQQFEGQVRSILKVRSVFSELTFLKQGSLAEKNKSIDSYLSDILIQTFMAGVQALDMDELEQTYRAISRARVQRHTPPCDTTAKKLELIKSIETPAATIDELLDFWRQLFVEVKGGLDVMEGLERSYIPSHQWSSGKIERAMGHFEDEFDAVLKQVCGATWAKIKGTANNMLLLAAETPDLSNRIERMNYKKALETATRLSANFLGCYSQIRKWIAASGLRRIEAYNDLVFMMRDRVKYNELFKAVFLQAVCGQSEANEEH